MQTMQYNNTNTDRTKTTFTLFTRVVVHGVLTANDTVDVSWPVTNHPFRIKV